MNSINFILHSLLSKPQQNFLLSLFSTIFILCCKVDFTNLSRYSQILERTYRRQFERSFNFIKGNVSLIGQAISVKAGQVIAIDCSFIPKSRKATYGIEYFYNRTAGRAEKGLEISLLAIVDVDTKQGYAFSLQQTQNLSNFTSRRFDPREEDKSLSS